MTEPSTSVTESGKSSWQRLVWKLTAALAVAIIVIAILLEFLFLNQKGNTLGQCVNNVLGDRQKVSDTPALIEEAQASAQWAQAVLGLFSLPQHPTPQQSKAESAAFLHSTVDYARHLQHAEQLLQSNAAYRTAHPFGKC